MAKKKLFQVHINYTAYIQYDANAESEEEAKQKVLDIIKEKGIYHGKKDIVDETYSITGIVDVDKSWKGL